MEIAWLLDFVCVAQTGVFARAAEKRNVTQPALTRRIKRLEYRLGIEIIDRSVHPVALTEAGQKFLPVAQDIIYQWERSRSELSSSGPAIEKIRLATLQSLSVSYVPNLIKRLYPNGRAPYIKVIADNFAGCIEALMSGDVDALLCYSHKDLQTGDHVLDKAGHNLGYDRLIPVSGIDHGHVLFTLEDTSVPYLKYSSTSFLGRITTQLIRNAESSPNLVPVYEDSIAAALKSAAIQGLGVAWLPEALIQSELEAGILKKIGDSALDFEMPIEITIYEGKRKLTHTTERLWDKVNSVTV